MSHAPVSDDFYNHVLPSMFAEAGRYLRKAWRRVRVTFRIAQQVATGFLVELPYFISSFVFLIATVCVVVASVLMWSGLAGLFVFGGMLAVYSVVWINDRHLPPPSSGPTEL